MYRFHVVIVLIDICSALKLIFVSDNNVSSKEYCFFVVTGAVCMFARQIFLNRKSRCDDLSVFVTLILPLYIVTCLLVVLIISLHLPYILCNECGFHFGFIVCV